MKNKANPKQLLLHALRNMEEKLTEEKKPTVKKKSTVKRKLALNHILIIIFSICAFGFTLFPMFDVSWASIQYDPQFEELNVYHDISWTYSPFLNLGSSAWGLPLLICPVILPIVVCSPLSEQHRKLWTCTIAALNLGIFVLCYFLAKEACSDYWYSYENEIVIFYILRGFRLGTCLLTGAHGACFLIAILPDRLFRKKQAAPAMRQNSLADRHTDTGICKTCGAELRQDGTCPDCYERLAFFNHMMKGMKSSSKNLSGRT